MPSPVAHISVAFLLYRIIGHFIEEGRIRYYGNYAVLLLVCLFFSMLPDLDAVPMAGSGAAG